MLGFGRMTSGLAVGALAIGAALFMVTPGVAASTSGSGYGAGATYQVELSSNVPGEGFWIWAELGADQTGNYQETDCIHLGGGHATDAAAHSAGDVSGWAVSGGILTMDGINIIGGLETVDSVVNFSPMSSGYEPATSVKLTVTDALVSNPPIHVGTSFTLPVDGEVAPKLTGRR
ncbi:MAG: hypothetical protein ACYCS9_04665 [Candidatus Dormibacteria bacterium]